MAWLRDFPGIVPDTIDLSAYMDAGPDAVLVRPARDFVDRVLAELRGDESVSGVPLPWAKTDSLFAFRPGEMTVWTGFKGHGKSMLASQILLQAMARGERAFVMSPEFSVERLLIRKIRQAAQCHHPAEGFIRRFLGWANDRLWLFDHQGGLKSETVTAVSRYAVDRHSVTHILIDSLMKCGIDTEDYERQKRFVDDLQSIAHQTGIHVHLVAHARKGENDDKPPNLHDVKGASEVCDMAENVLSVWKNKRKMKAQSLGNHGRDDEMDAILTVESQRNGDGWTGSIKL